MKNGYAFEIQEMENDNGQIGLAVVIGGLVSIFVQYGETLGPVSSILVMGVFCLRIPNLQDFLPKLQKSDVEILYQIQYYR